MDQSELIDPDWVVRVWVTTGIEDFFLSFRMSESIGHSRYDQFLNAMGLELVCKGYLLTVKRPEYEGLVETQAREKVYKLAKSMDHKIAVLVEDISKIIGHDKVQSVLNKKYGGFTGSQNLEAIEAAYLECRYPIAPNPFYKNFPLKGLKDTYEDPVYSSGLHGFCYEFCRLILHDLKSRFGIGIPKSWWNQKIKDDAGRRFGNLLFDSRKENFLL